MSRNLVIATRGSRLALTQSEWVAAELRKFWPGLNVSLKVVKTTGDRMQTENLPGAALSKGLFTKEIEVELLENRADLAVHSFKDLPVESPEGLVIGAVPPRAAANDVLVLLKGQSMESLGEGAVIYTGSPRRKRQWLARFPRTQVEPIRGNVDTRLQKLKAGHGSRGLLLAAAGLSRLTVQDPELDFIELPFDWMLPAPAQGALAVQVRASDAELLALLRPLDHAATRKSVDAERGFLQAMGGGCQAPLGAYASWPETGQAELAGIYFSAEESAGERHSVKSQELTPSDLGRRLTECFRR